MCRYAHHVYKAHYVCFSCRKMFRQPDRFEMARPIGRDDIRKAPCPQCGALMINMGKDFKAPRQADGKQWLKVEILYAAGYNFHSCGCGGSGPKPRTLQEVKPFIEEQKRLNAEAVRQRVILERARKLSEVRGSRARLCREKKNAGLNQ